MTILSGKNSGTPQALEAAEEVRAILQGSRRFVEVLEHCAALDLPGWYLAAGCVTQTVWNHLTGRPVDGGIRDYDLIYFDDADLSWEAENDVIQLACERVRSLPVELEVRNQARVHLWYESRYGIPCPPYTSSESAIDSFPSTATSIGVRLTEEGVWRFYAPFGFDDLLRLVVRPNLVLAPAEVYAQKAARWKKHWPELRIESVPSPG